MLHRDWKVICCHLIQAKSSISVLAQAQQRTRIHVTDKIATLIKYAIVHHWKEFNQLSI